MLINLTGEKIQESRKSHIEALVMEYQDKIYFYCYNILRNPYDAEDAAQEVFVKAFQSKRLLEIDHYSAWLYKIAYHHCLNKIKRKGLIEFIPFIESNQIVEGNSSSDFELDYILSKLKPKERSLIVLRIIEDKDFAEIGNILDISASTARKRFERVKAKIQRVIERRLQNEK